MTNVGLSQGTAPWTSRSNLKVSWRDPNDLLLHDTQKPWKSRRRSILINASTRRPKSIPSSRSWGSKDLTPIVETKGEVDLTRFRILLFRALPLTRGTSNFFPLRSHSSQIGAAGLPKVTFSSAFCPPGCPCDACRFINSSALLPGPLRSRLHLVVGRQVLKILMPNRILQKDVLAGRKAK